MSNDTSSAVDEQVVIKDEPAVLTKSEQEQHQALQDFSKMNASSAIRVRIASPFHEYYNNVISSLTAVNATGPFDILSKHHNFISLLLPCELVVRNLDESEQKIRISGGLMHVKADQVIIFLDV